jgi:hypothetical protein
MSVARTYAVPGGCKSQAVMGREGRNVIQNAECSSKAPFLFGILSSAAKPLRGPNPCRRRPPLFPHRTVAQSTCPYRHLLQNLYWRLSLRGRAGNQAYARHVRFHLHQSLAQLQGCGELSKARAKNFGGALPILLLQRRRAPRGALQPREARYRLPAAGASSQMCDFKWAETSVQQDRPKGGGRPSGDEGAAVGNRSLTRWRLFRNC